MLGGNQSHAIVTMTAAQRIVITRLHLVSPRPSASKCLLIRKGYV